MIIQRKREHLPNEKKRGNITMKCATELMTIAKVKAEEIARAEQEKRERETMARIARTIKHCEELGNTLESMAEQGKEPSLVFYTDKHYRPMKPTHDDYADGRQSFIWSYDDIDLEMLKEYFEQYCFNLTIKQFDYWCYGLGLNQGYVITISPAPKCSI
jgi:hypothetical protein